MAINAKAVSVLFVKFFQISMKFICKYAKKYPLPSTTVFIVFILHLFFPFAFIFLVFSVPFFLVSYIIYRRFVHSSSKPQTHKQKTLESIEPETDQNAEVKNRDINSQITRRRRNVKPNIDETNQQGDVKRVKFHVTSDNDDNSAIERKEKVEERDREVAEEPLKDDAEETEDEDDAQEDRFGNQIVEWTEDDQKNLMEVGFSELEKNLTLENLIAKRNAGKFPMSPKAPATTVPHVSVTRSNPFDQIPGTAPSVFSRNNPFDLPIEGSGGGRNVKFDIFEQDLVGLDRNKDKFCRHQSFTRGTSFSAENLQNQESRMLGLFSCMERILAGESVSDKGDHDRLIEQLLYQDESSEVASSPSSAKLGEQVTEETAKPSAFGESDSGKAKDPSPREEGSGGTLLSSSESEELKEIPPAIIENNKTFVSSNRDIANSSTNGALDKANQTLLNDYVNRNVSQHHSIGSVASDMQVEVSEPASPRNVSSIGDLQSLVSEAIHSVDNSDSVELLISSKGNTAESSENDREEISNNQSSELKQLDMKETDKNISTSTARNVGDNANPNTTKEIQENPDSPTQHVTLEHKSEVIQGSHEQSEAPLEQIKSEPLEKIHEES